MKRRSRANPALVGVVALSTAAVLLFGIIAAVQAQSSFPTVGGSQVDGKVEMCLNSQAQAIPCSGVSVSGPIAATSGTVVLPISDKSTVGISVTGTWSGALQVQASVDYGTVGAAAATWGATTAVALTNGGTVLAITGNGVFQVNAAGFSAIRVFGTNIASGTANIAMVGSSAVSTVMADNNFPVTLTSQYPLGSIPVTASATGTTGATTATLPAGQTTTTYLCGFSIRANAQVAATGNATVTGTVTGTLNFTQWTAPLASGIGVTEPPIGNPCIPASGANQAIAVVSAAPGTGGVVSVSAWGYRQ